MSKEFHVVQTKKEWLVKRKGATLSSHTTQKYAIASAIERATPIGAKIVVHGKTPKDGIYLGIRNKI